MKTSRLLLIVSVLAMAAVALPASAADPLPDSCAGRGGTIELADDETLVETTYYFRGQSQVGNVDGNDNEWGLTMTEEEPSEDVSKVYASVFGNDQFARNFLMGFFNLEFDNPTRIVCAFAAFHASGPANSIPIQLFVDASSGVGEHEVHAGIATASGPGLAVFQGGFRRLDATATWDITFQFNPAAPGNAVYYDSTTHPSSLTIVTVEQQP